MDAGTYVVVGALGLVVIQVLREFVVAPRRHRRHLLATAASVAGQLGLEVRPATDSFVLVEGKLEGRKVELRLSDFGCVASAEMRQSSIAKSVRIYNTAGWSHQKGEAWMSGNAAPTGDALFDEQFVVYAENAAATVKQLPPRVREVLLRHCHAGLYVDHAQVTVGTGTPTPHGYLGGQARPQTDECVRLARRALALAADLESVASTAL